MSQDIKDRLRSAPLWNGSTLHAEAADHIEALERQLADLRQAPGWISVEDRLPEVGQEVILFRPEAEETNDPPIVVRKFSGLSRASPQGVEHGFECWCHPSHWMPKPVAPSAGQAMLRDDRREG